ncbi:MAG: FprA family A-type flavoprotein [Bacilli bacterium]|nr:FprA family A-type flavoprotein [Bacilli bacterium]MBN2696086.1 FprA family A-type flavoprotein [Bacilli bacterium]
MQTNTLPLSKTVHWVGVNDYDLRIFDIVMETKFGTTYNAYLIKGKDKTALIDTTKANFGDDFIAKVESLEAIDKIDYLVLNHTEPDHSGSVIQILEKNPEITIIASGPGLSNLKEILNRPFKSIRATDDLKISLGDKELSFFIQPNLHWPDTLFTYLPDERMLFTCDYFGAHYAFEGVFAKNVPDRNDYVEALKNYFDSIMSPFKPDVIRALDKIKDLDLEYIATSHGPVLDETIMEEAKKLYRQWATESKKNAEPLIVMAIASAYGYTAKMADRIALAIEKELQGKVRVEKYDVVEADTKTIVSRIVEADAFLIGTTTILKDTVKPIWDILVELNPEIHGKKIASAFGSYGWSGEGVINVMQRLAQLKMKTIDGLRIRFNPSEDQLNLADDFGIRFAKMLKDQ